MSATRKKTKVTLDTVRREAGRLMWRHRRTLAIGLVLMVVGRLAAFVVPLASKYVVDEVLTQGRAELLVPLALATLAATIVQAGTAFALARVVSVTAQRAIADMRVEIQDHVLRLPVSYFDRTKSGVLISRIMTDPEGIRNLVGTGIVQLVGGLFTATIAFGFLMALNWRLTLGTVVLLLLYAAIMSIAFKKLRPIFRERGKINAEITGRLAEALGGVRLLKVYVAEAREKAVFGGGVDRLFRNIASTITGTSIVANLSAVVVGGVSVMIMIVGGRAVLAGTMSLGDIISYTILVGMMVSPLIGIANISTQVSEAFAGLDRIREVREVATEDDEDETKDALAEELSGDVAFENVTFSYDEGVPVLRDVSFAAAAGSTTALVGPSGAGKSTLIGLIMAFDHPDEGRLLVDGRDLTSIRLRDYRGQLGVVLQDNFLFDGTIRENITFASPDIGDAELEEAARIAHADEFIERFADRYDTVVGERGVKLSGGQRQRVAIARAILADPRVLILDEATSSLDSESEALIRDGLRSLRHGRTTFVIAHRLSTITSADQILVMDGGRIVERGTHHDLMEVGGLYRRLYERQHQLETDLFINPGEDPIPED
ncbi:MAG: ABC transporter ATP-binding protein [Gemmatimonadota bacterium]